MKRLRKMCRLLLICTFICVSFGLAACEKDAFEMQPSAAENQAVITVD